MTPPSDLPFLSALLLVWALVHAYAAVYHGFVYLKLRSSPDFLAFAVTTGGHALFCIGSSRIVSAETLADGMLGQQVQWLALPFIFTGFAGLARSLLGAKGRRPTGAVIVWALVGAAAILAGLVLDPDRPAVSLYHEAALTPVGKIYVAGSLFVVGWMLVALMRAKSRDRDTIHLAITSLPTVLAWGWDSAVRVFEWRAPYLVDHASLFTSLGVSYLLMGRFVRASEALSERTRELLRNYDRRRRLERELVRKEQLATVGELSAVIAIELGFPLDALRHAVSRLRGTRCDDTAERSRLLTTLDAQADRLNRLVRDLLVYARPVEPGHERIDVPELVREVVDASPLRAERPDGIVIRLDLDEISRPLIGSTSLLRDAFANVVENAVQAMPGGGTFTVRAEDGVVAGHSVLRLFFEDTGEGMHARVRDRARDPFFTTRPAGTGLGLAIVDRVVRAHGGQLEIRSDRQGTRVVLALPWDRQTRSLPPTG